MSSRFLALSLLCCLVLAASSAVAKPSPKKDVTLVMQLSAARALPTLSKKAKPTLLAIKAKLEAGDQAQAKEAFAAFIKAERPSEAQALTITRWLIRTAVLEKNRALADPADRARFYSEQTAALREHLAELRDLRLDGSAPFSVKQLILTPTYSPGAVAFRYATTASELTLAQLDALISKVEAQLTSVGDLSETSKLDLEAASQKQQQLLTLLSSLLKQWHETAQSIIRNSKA